MFSQNLRLILKINWIRFRARATLDTALAHGPHRLLSAIIDHININRLGPDSNWPLTWQMVNQWLGVKEKRAYAYIKALINYGFLMPRGVKGCPPKSYFSFLVNSPFLEGNDSPQEDGNDSPEKDRINSPQKGANLESNPFRRRVQRRRKEDSSAPEGRNEAPERSREAVPACKVDAERDAALLASLRATVEFPEPPARGRSGRVAAK